MTDEKWLLFVVEQVLSNALKYTPAAGTVTIDLEEPKTLCIRDTGMGIAPGRTFPGCLKRDIRVIMAGMIRRPAASGCICAVGSART